MIRLLVLWILASALAAAGILHWASAPAWVTGAVLVVVALTMSAYEPSRLCVVYFSLLINLFFLAVAALWTDGQISYLSDDEFVPYYSKALCLELMFWASFALAHQLFPGSTRRVLAPGLSAVGLRATSVLVAALLMLCAEVSISSGTYFSPYTEFSETGTLLYEWGALTLSIGLLARRSARDAEASKWLEFAGVGLVLLIALGSGKRLPAAYVVTAYIVAMLPAHGRFRGAVALFLVSTVGYAWGVLRDLMTLSGVGMDAFGGGLESTNQGAVLHASAVYVRLVDESLAAPIDRIVSMASNFVGALLVPISLLPEVAQINVFAMRFYAVQGNGGFIGPYAYFFLGWAGPLVLGVFVAWLLRRHSGWGWVLGTVVLLCSPRWMLYNVGPVVRLLGLTLLLFLVLRLLSSGYRSSRSTVRLASAS